MQQNTSVSTAVRRSRHQPAGTKLLFWLCGTLQGRAVAEAKAHARSIQFERQALSLSSCFQLTFCSSSIASQILLCDCQLGCLEFNATSRIFAAHKVNLLPQCGVMYTSVWQWFQLWFTHARHWQFCFAPPDILRLVFTSFCQETLVCQQEEFVFFPGHAHCNLLLMDDPCFHIGGQGSRTSCQIRGLGHTLIFILCHLLTQWAQKASPGCRQRQKKWL